MGETKGAQTHHRGREQTHQSVPVQEQAMQNSELGGMLQGRGQVCGQEVLEDGPDKDSDQKGGRERQAQDEHVPELVRAAALKTGAWKPVRRTWTGYTISLSAPTYFGLCRDSVA